MAPSSFRPVGWLWQCRRARHKPRARRIFVAEQSSRMKLGRRRRREQERESETDRDRELGRSQLPSCDLVCARLHLSTAREPVEALMSTSAHSTRVALVRSNRSLSLVCSLGRLAFGRHFRYIGHSTSGSRGGLFAPHSDSRSSLVDLCAPPTSQIKFTRSQRVPKPSSGAEQTLRRNNLDSWQPQAPARRLASSSFDLLTLPLAEAR